MMINWHGAGAVARNFSAPRNAVELRGLARRMVIEVWTFLK
jgi:hypothetical protein